MQDENPGNTGWKNKLESLDCLAEEKLDKAAAWTKLHQRMQQKPASKRAAWYWIAAAACLLFAIAIVWLLQPHEKAAFAKNTRVLQSKKSPVTKVEVTDSNVMLSQQQPTEKKHDAVKVAPGKKNQSSAPAYVVFNDSSLNKSSTVVETPPNVSASVAPDSIVLAIVKPVQKKLRVVHINELGLPALQPVQIAQNDTHDFFPKRSFESEGSSRFTITRNSSDNILKIKLSPSN